MKKDENVAFDGHCAFAVSTGKLDVKGGNHELLKHGKRYKFSNGVAKFLFKVLPERTEKANRNWRQARAQD